VRAVVVVAVAVVVVEGLLLGLGVALVVVRRRLLVAETPTRVVISLAGVVVLVGLGHGLVLVRRDGLVVVVLVVEPLDLVVVVVGEARGAGVRRMPVVRDVVDDRLVVQRHRLWVAEPGAGGLGRRLGGLVLRRPRPRVCLVERHAVVVDLTGADRRRRVAALGALAHRAQLVGRHAQNHRHRVGLEVAPQQHRRRRDREDARGLGEDRRPLRGVVGGDGEVDLRWPRPGVGEALEYRAGHDVRGVLGACARETAVLAPGVEVGRRALRGIRRVEERAIGAQQDLEPWPPMGRDREGHHREAAVEAPAVGQDRRRRAGRGRHGRRRRRRRWRRGRGIQGRGAGHG
jgi:hypothetical protein